MKSAHNSYINSQHFLKAFARLPGATVGVDDLSIFYRQFAALMSAGIPLFQALATLEGTTANRKLKDVIKDCRWRLEKGTPLAAAFEAHPDIFSRPQIEMIRAAEAGGILDRTLGKIADYVEREWRQRQEIRRRMYFPILNIIAAVMILGFSRRGPALTLLVTGGIDGSYSIADYLRDTIGFALLCIVLVTLAFKIFRFFLDKRPPWRENVDRLKLYIPVIGKTIRCFTLARFGWTFAALFESGLSIVTGLKLAGEASGNTFIRNAAYRCESDIKKGVPLSRALQEQGISSPVILSMLQTGETSGTIDRMMQKAAEYLQNEGEVSADRNVRLFTTLIYLFVGVTIALYIIRFWSGYYQRLGGT
jgi:type II secretory pathway component PulF